MEPGAPPGGGERPLSPAGGSLRDALSSMSVVEVRVSVGREGEGAGGGAWRGQGGAARPGGKARDPRPAPPPPLPPPQGDPAGGGGGEPVVRVFFCEVREGEREREAGARRQRAADPATLLSQTRHGAGDAPHHHQASDPSTAVSRWRQKERTKTTAVALVLCLNIGVDPPDALRISPCARLECWVDPLSMAPPKALETIGKNLQAQYERWQPRARYRMHLDPTLDDVKKLATGARRAARAERVLLHYNGHGVPRPTSNGEVWVFNKSYTQYIPLSVYDLMGWVGSPAIYVLDCPAAGLVAAAFRAFATQRAAERGDDAPPGADPLADTILLAACGAHEALPACPDLPADAFTACLTTPIKAALRWHASRSPLAADGVTRDLVDRIPGRAADRKTPLGELNWVFTAVTDTIAWNLLPRSLFHRLFRQDLLVASLFRNFLLAERVMRGAGVTPRSHPPLPRAAHHRLWSAWDAAAEATLLQLPALLAAGPDAAFTPSPFFADQLTAFELWLERAAAMGGGGPPAGGRPPEQLPVVLQVLLSQVHRLRALVLLARFLDAGAWAVDLALSVGIFPYVLKLLQTSAADLRGALAFIWAKILALDPSCQADLAKDGGHLYFVRQLDAPAGGDGGAAGAPGASPPAPGAAPRAHAAFVLAAVCDGHPRGRALCVQAGLLDVLCRRLVVAAAGGEAARPPPRPQPDPLPPATGGVDGDGEGGWSLLVQWLALALGSLVDGAPTLSGAAAARGAPGALAALLTWADPEIRAAAVFALGSLVCVDDGGLGAALDGEGEGGAAAGGDPPPPRPPSPAPDAAARAAAEAAAAEALLGVVGDGSPLVRREAAAALARLAAAAGPEELAAAVAAAAAATAAAVVSPRTGSPPPPESPRGARPPAPLPVAARVLSALAALAADPAPAVAATAETALRAAGVDVEPVPGAVGVPARGSPSRSGGGAAGSAGSGPASAPGPSSASRWKPLSWRTGADRSSVDRERAPVGGSARAASSAAASSPPGSPLNSPPRAGAAAPWPPFVLRAASDVAGGGGDDSVGRRGASDDGRTASGVGGAPPLPSSAAYAAARAKFSAPMLTRDGDGWAGVPPPPRGARDAALTAARDRERAAAVAACASAYADGARVVDSAIVSIETGVPATEALALHPFRPALAAAGADGVLRVYSSSAVDPTPGTGASAGALGGPACTNAFPLDGGALDAGASAAATAARAARARGAPALFLINETHASVLVAGGADGAVRVWRDWSFRGAQLLASAWQAAPPSAGASPAGPRPPACYALDQGRGVIYAAGAGGGASVAAWALAAERRSALLAAAPPGGASVTRLAAPAAPGPPVVAAGLYDGSVVLLDARSGGARAAAVRPHAGAPPLAGMVAGPGGRPHQLVTACAAGELAFVDWRGAGGAGAAPAAAVVAAVTAHSTGGLSALAAHPHAPLLATGTTSQVVKLWSAAGESLGTVRAHGPLLSARPGAVAALAFHPYRGLLASAGRDPFIAIFPVAPAGGVGGGRRGG